MEEDSEEAQQFQDLISRRLYWRLVSLSREHRIFRQLGDQARQKDSSPGPGALVKAMTKRYGEGMFDQPLALKTARSILKSYQTIRNHDLVGTLRLPPEVGVDELLSGISEEERRDLLRIQSPFIDAVARSGVAAASGYTSSVILQIAVEMEPLGPSLREDLFARLVRILEQHLARLLDINLGNSDVDTTQDRSIGRRTESVHTMIRRFQEMLPGDFDENQLLIAEIKQIIAIRDSIVHRESRADQEFKRWVSVDDYHYGSLLDTSDESLRTASDTVFGFLYRSLFMYWKMRANDLRLAGILLDQTQSDLLLHEEWHSLFLSTDFDLDEFGFDEETRQVLRVNSLLGAKNHFGVERVKLQTIESNWIDGVEWELVKSALLDDDQQVLRILHEFPDLEALVEPRNKVFDQFRSRRLNGTLYEPI